MYYFGVSALIICLAISFYLFDRYRVQKWKNLTTLFWSLGFLAAATAIISAIVIIFEETFPLDGYEKLLILGGYLLPGLALFFFYLGASRLAILNLFFRLILPFLIFLISGSSIFFKILSARDVSSAYSIDLIFVFGMLLPFGLLLTFVFARLLRELVLLNQPVQSRYGALLIALGWFLFCILAFCLIFVQNKKTLDIWFGFLTLVGIIIFVGILFLEKGVSRALDVYLKTHGLKKLKVKD